MIYNALFGLAAEDWEFLANLAMALIVLVWKLVWYAIALFKTIERKQIRWFTVLIVGLILLPFDLGLLAIIYLLLYKNPDKKKSKKKKIR